MASKKRFSVNGSLRKMDSRLQRGLNNGFAAVLGGKLVPSEVEQRLSRQLADNSVATYEGFTESPNVFTVKIAAKDFAAFTQNHASFPVEVADMLQRQSRNNGWVSAGPVVVTIVEDSSLRTGQVSSSCASDPQPAGGSGYVSADGSFIGQHHPPVAVTPQQPAPDPVVYQGGNYPPAQAPNQWADRPAHNPAVAGFPPAGGGYQPPPPQPLTYAPAGNQGAADSRPPTVTLLLLDGSSRTYLVAEGSNIIGRGQEADFRLPDTGVSRRHCSIAWDGRDAVLTDLNSTNGTTVNDIVVDNWLLADGDVITVGHSYIEVRITARTSAAHNGGY